MSSAHDYNDDGATNNPIRRIEGAFLMRTVLLSLLVSATVAAPTQPQGVSNRAIDDRAPAPIAAVNGQADPRGTVLLKPRTLPPSRQHALPRDSSTAALRLPPVDHDALLAKDRIDGTVHKRLRVGIRRDVHVLPEDGQWHTLTGTGRLWTLNVISQGAMSIRLHFSDVDLPDGAQLYVWSSDAPELVEGPFTGRGPLGKGEFWSTILPGESVVIEYFEPDGADPKHELPFKIDGVSHAYRDLFSTSESSREGDCHNDSSCYPGWADVRDAVARFTIIDEADSFLCTGQLLNTEGGDFTPYFLTAKHCCATQEIAETLVAYWFFHSDSCDGSVPSPANVPTSSVADLLDSGGSTVSSDYALLLIRGELPSGLFWSGWTSDAVEFGEPSTSIHHPDGTFKRTSFGLRGLADGNFWRVDWTDGPTEPGSSGAGVWRDDTQQLYGQLSGGPSSCSNENYDYYGKFSTAYSDIAALLVEGSDDDLEDNDSCAAAVDITEGTWLDRTVKLGDDDWYRINVPGCADLQIALSFVDAFGDIDIEVYDACGGAVIASSTGTDNGEAVSIPAADSPQDYFLRVYLASDTRSNYDLTAVMSGVGVNTRLILCEGTAGLPAQIPDNNPGGITVDLAIPESETILDLDLDLEIQHTWNGDLVVTLSHGAATAILIDRPGRDLSGAGFNDKGFDITLDDAIPTNIEDYDGGGATVVGAFSPGPDSLSLFNGMDQAGTWSINVTDHLPDDEGSLLGWTLRITTTADSACERTDAAANRCHIADDRFDLIDLAYFQTCFTGGGAARLGYCCGAFDLDPDDDVDLDDFAILKTSLNGPAE